MIVAAPLPPLPGQDLLLLLLQLGILLGTAVALGRLAARLGAPSVVGELAAGVLLGPSLLAHAAPHLAVWLPRDAGHQHLLDAVGQLGVLLLVGVTGMHLDLDMVRRRGGVAAGVSAGGLLVPLGLGIGAGLLLPAWLIGAGTERGVFALFLGVALCVSALPVISKTLLEMRLLHRDVGQLVLSAAAVDDLAGWLLLSVVSAMATEGLRERQVVLPLVLLVVVVVTAAVVVRPLAVAGLRLAGRSREPGVSAAVAVVVLLLCGAGTQALGLEPILGTFLGGVAIGSSGGLNLAWLRPLHTVVVSVLAPIFFASAGLRMDLTALAHPAVALSAFCVLAVAILGKFAGAYVGARAGRLGHWEGLAIGAGLNARGVIEVVVATVGLRLGVLAPATYTIVVLIAVATSAMAPPALRYAMRHLEETSSERARQASHVGAPNADALMR